MYGDEMGYAIQEVFEKSYPSYLAAYSSYPDSHKVAQAILNCKTPMMGETRQSAKIAVHPIPITILAVIGIVLVVRRSIKRSGSMQGRRMWWMPLIFMLYLRYPMS